MQLFAARESLPFGAPVFPIRLRIGHHDLPAAPFDLKEFFLRNVQTGQFSAIDEAGINPNFIR